MRLRHPAAEAQVTEAAAALTDHVYEDWVWAYGEVCGICGRPPSKKRPKLDRDHDHVTGQPRGLLCPICNMKLADLKLEWLRAAADYLERSNGAANTGPRPVDEGADQGQPDQAGTRP